MHEQNRAGSLLGVVLAARGQASPAQRWRPLVSVAGLVGLATFALSAWVTPRANQTFRERAIQYLTAANPGTQVGPVSRGDREMVFGELGAHAAELRGRGLRVAAGRLDLEWHKKPALAMWGPCLAVTVLGLGAIGRRRPQGPPAAAGTLAQKNITPAASAFRNR